MGSPLNHGQPVPNSPSVRFCYNKIIAEERARSSSPGSAQSRKRSLFYSIAMQSKNKKSMKSKIIVHENMAEDHK
jgi:hypothetical protein